MLDPPPLSEAHARGFAETGRWLGLLAVVGVVGAALLLARQVLWVGSLQAQPWYLRPFMSPLAALGWLGLLVGGLLACGGARAARRAGGGQGDFGALGASLAALVKLAALAGISAMILSAAVEAELARRPTPAATPQAGGRAPAPAGAPKGGRRRPGPLAAPAPPGGAPEDRGERAQLFRQGGR